MLHAHWVWPTSALVVLYAADVPQGVQAASPALENCCAGQVPHAALVVAVHGELRYLPAAQLLEEQFAQGASTPGADHCTPSADHVPAGHAGACAHSRLVEFQR